MPRIRLVFAVSLLVSLWAAKAVAESGFIMPQNACSPTIDKELGAHSVNRADIDRISIAPRYENRGNETNRVLGIDAWVRFKSCPGYLVIDMERNCSLRQVYTSGRCSVPGVKGF
jgi:hypothetical protein